MSRSALAFDGDRAITKILQARGGTNLVNTLIMKFGDSLSNWDLNFFVTSMALFLKGRNIMEYPVIAFFWASVVIPVFATLIMIERRLTKIETLLNFIYKDKD